MESQPRFLQFRPTRSSGKSAPWRQINQRLLSAHLRNAGG
jgi:hypothetical protein